jgi:hypothetical protein
MDPAMLGTTLAELNVHGALATGMWGLALAAALFVLSNLALIGIVVALPADFFCHAPPACAVQGRRWGVYLALMIAKNAVGLLLLLLGIPLILPGVPGPGLILILLGLALLDFPGKRRLERRLLSYPGVLRTVNRLRTRFGRSPLQLDEIPSTGHTPRTDQ